MVKPLEYRLAIAGFGIWRIAYEPPKKRWTLAFNARASGEQWVPAGEFLLAESAVRAVTERNTGARSWDSLRFALPANSDLKYWITEASDGVQADAMDGVEE